MTRNEKALARQLFEVAADHFSNHGCNDVEEYFFDGMGDLELEILAKKIEEWNGTPDEFDPSHNARYYPDWLLMKYFAEKLCE